MRTRISVLLTAALTTAMSVAFAVAPTPAGAQAVTSQAFSGYSTGTVISSNALQLGDTAVGKVGAAFSGDSLNSQGLNTPIQDELGFNVQPAVAGADAHGRGTGLEVGLVVPAAQQTDVNQLLLSGLAEANAPPPTPLITKDIPLNLAPLATASLLRGQAQAIFDPNVCAIGQPAAFGLGSASDLRLVGAPDAALVGTVSAGTGPAPNTVSQSQSFSYFIPNPDGSFGLVSETHQIIAPIALANGPLGPALTIEAAGEFVLRATATGIPGDPRNGITYPGNPVITIKGPAGVVLATLKLSDLLGTNGLNLDLSPVALLSLGQAPRAIGGAPGSAPTVAADGTTASAAVDAVSSVGLLNIPGLSALDLRLGHMEAQATVPAGGVHCNIPVAKSATPDPAQAGQDVTWTVSIPSDPTLFSTFFACDLVNLNGSDVHITESGNVKFTLTSADHGGVISGNKVTFNDLGTYKRGDPPIQVHIVGHVTSGSGVMQDTATVSAALGNCTGGVVGQLIAGQAVFQGAGITGAVTLHGPQVSGGNLAATGADTRYLVLGGFLLLGAYGIRRRIRGRAVNDTTTSS